ncbi:MAG: hypothetical protein ACHQVS_00755 [Candidatus Babeliales bacterium]
MSYHQWEPKPLFDEDNPDPRQLVLKDTQIIVERLTGPGDTVEVVQEEYVPFLQKIKAYYAADNDWRDGIPPAILKKYGGMWVNIATGKSYNLVR